MSLVVNSISVVEVVPSVLTGKILKVSLKKLRAIIPQGKATLLLSSVAPLIETSVQISELRATGSQLDSASDYSRSFPLSLWGYNAGILGAALGLEVSSMVLVEILDLVVDKHIITNIFSNLKRDSTVTVIKIALVIVLD